MNGAIHTVTPNPALDQTVTLDALRTGSVNLARAAHVNAGGKGVNVASCLADWGLPVHVHGLLGRGNSGPFEQLFADKRINDRMLRVAGACRVNIKLADLETGDTTDINLPGPETGEAELAALASGLAHVGAGDLAVLAGSLPPGLPRDALARLCAQLKRQGAWVLADSSGSPLAAVLANPPEALPDCVKPNREELAQWAGHPLPALDDVVRCARGLQRMGVGRVVVSLGEQGALLVDADTSLLASLPPQRPLSTVGAGDALVAGLAAAKSQGLDAADSLRLAVAFSAAKLQRVGPHLPPEQQIRELAAAVSLQTLDAA
ncbi:1-phosphofructokinase [Chromobacterium vaccinii]|uniref:1-phosphofructokinase n=1 Tax=Chromobacterium piscinae TaxID=686831 RepID=UPI00140C4464|nr:1-phosphofructokinase [Chromobacterium vaccinii]MBX9348031.1 1-phosphofructokinase [Chromobacterium vaccinii]MBX9359255.1 1-phosphofructokinase [Chromobacterium vaccinii]NHQ80327.1 1-phosphofructokinase [Chromobacterium vaccinii]